MEEKSIKIIEDFCEIFRNTQKSIDKLERNDYGAIIGEEEIQAIEKLIARYKELEVKQNKNIQVSYGGRRYNTEGIIIKDFIPKSKVQERIEELKECCKNCNFRGSICKDFKAFNQCTFQLTIKNLQELIED